jgi:hypothetical protein
MTHRVPQALFAIRREAFLALVNKEAMLFFP